MGTERRGWLGLGDSAGRGNVVLRRSMGCRALAENAFASEAQGCFISEILYRLHIAESPRLVVCIFQNPKFSLLFRHLLFRLWFLSPRTEP